MINNIILDTTFILPLFGIEILLTPNFENEIKSLWKNGHEDFQVYLPSVCLIETVYKLNRAFRKKNDMDILRRYYQILPTVITSKIVKIYHPHLDPTASKIALLIKKEKHDDLMDCWIAATATVLNGYLLTEDVPLKKILRTIPETRNVVCWSWKDLQEFLNK